MALATTRVPVRQTGVQLQRNRCAKVMAVHRNGSQPQAAFAAAAAAAVLLLSGPASASPSLSFNPLSDAAKDPVTKLLNKLDSQDPPKGVPGPEVEGQFRANPDKARALAAENSPAGSPEAEAKGAALLSK